MWKYPRPHNFKFGFKLHMEAPTKASTIVPYVMQDNALVDYETIKTNPANDDFAVYAGPNVCQGSKIPKIAVTWSAWALDSEASFMKFVHFPIHTAFLERLTAFDKKTGTTVASLIEMTYETTDEQAYPLWNGTKLAQVAGLTLPTNVPGLTTNQVPEGVAFDMDTYFDAHQYYSNKEMLKKVTSNLRFEYLRNKQASVGPNVINRSEMVGDPICKSANPYMFCGKLFHVPQVDTIHQLLEAGDTTAVPHLWVAGQVRFLEYNSDFNFSKA